MKAKRWNLSEEGSKGLQAENEQRLSLYPGMLRAEIEGSRAAP